MKNVNAKGLSTSEVMELQKRYGKNEIVLERKKLLIQKIVYAIFEPIFLLLIIVSVIYFLLGEARDGIIMLLFVFGIIIMDVLQEWKTDKALSTLKKLSQPMILAVRDGEVTHIASTDLVPGDVILAEEGCRIPADGYVLSSHDFCMDESLLTGESGEVWKEPANITLENEKSIELTLTSVHFTKSNYCYAGTLVTQGNAAILIDKTGNETVYGKIGLSMAETKIKLTPLQKQMKDLMKACTVIAVLLFLLVGFITYFNLSDHTFPSRILESFLSGIVLSLSMIPAEFPVILTVFLSMGALRLTKKHALIRRLSAVETLGEVSVICVDKTGTLTQNQMTVIEVVQYGCEEAYLAEIAGLACDIEPHDPMETAILSYCSTLGISKKELFKGILIKGYPFTQECKTMTHVWRVENKILLTAKGSPEWLIEHSRLSEAERLQIEGKTLELFKKGLRVIGVGVMEMMDEVNLPEGLQECSFTFCGLLGFEDPPKDSIAEDIRKCKEAGIRLVMITGDNGDTAAAIAEQIHFPGDKTPMTGMQLETFTEAELQEITKKVNIFSRVIPEQKLRIVKAFIANGEIAAMTGDGVNDAPALKYADIGIAMGLRGSEVTREAADLILLDDNFSTILDSIEDGRRIYNNIRKAIGYVFTIHIPIALICLFGPLLHIVPDKLMLLPLHVVLLELIMNPTCAAAIERQSAEENAMKHGPRNPKDKLLTKGILLKSIAQGLAIFLSSFGSYYYFLRIHPDSADLARTIGLSVLILSNLFLILVNASNNECAFQSLGQLRKEKGIVFVLSATLILLLLIIYSPLHAVLMLRHLNLMQFLYTVVISYIFVFWYELVKMIKILK
ncbi:MAG: cation-translocating P-type ATPase [Anaerocolumna sp.]